MKKIVSVVLGVALAVGVAGCSKSEDAAAPGNDVSLLNVDEGGDANLSAVDNALPAADAAVDNAGGDHLHDNAADPLGNAAH